VSSSNTLYHVGNKSGNKEGGIERINGRAAAAILGFFFFVILLTFYSMRKSKKTYKA
jgi:hypothetical protein